MKKVILISTPVVILLITLIAAGTSETQNRVLNRTLEAFASDTSLTSASWGFHAVNISDGKIISSVNAGLALTPASTQKAITTLTALAMLGADYRFETHIQYDGKIENKILKGNLYITGSGDPSLGATQLHDSLDIENTFLYWLRDIRAAGIEKIEGHIIADGSYFDKHNIPPKWMWEDMGNYYGAGAHALSVYENMYTVFFQPGPQEGEPALVLRTEPRIPHMEFVNDVTTGPRLSGDRVYIYGVPRQKNRWLTGTVPLGQNDFAVRGSMPDPGLFLAHAFNNFLQKNKIQTPETVYTHEDAPQFAEPGTRTLLSRWMSPELRYIAEHTNNKSVNAAAENLIKTLGKKFGEEGSFSKGAEIINNFWKEQGVNTTGLRIHDGSGLSPFNNVTPAQLTAMLVFAAGNDDLFTNLIKGFPVAGKSGSLERLFLNSRSQGILMAKSGFLGNVRAYTGYTRNPKGELIAFTFIVNNYTGTSARLRNEMVKVMDAIGI